MNPDTAELAIVDARPSCAARAPERARGASPLRAARARAMDCAARGPRAHGAPCATPGGRCGSRACSCGSRAWARCSPSAAAPCATPSTPRAHARVRVARRPAGGPRGALGCLVVSGDRPLRLPPRPGSVHGVAGGLLPALPARPARALAISGCRRCSRACCCRWRARAGAVRHPPPHDARARRAARRCGASPGARGEVARLAVLLTAFAPMAFFFSAVYSESLYLALSVGVFWCARARPLGGGGGARGARRGDAQRRACCWSLPALILYLYGPREDRAPDFRAHAALPRRRYRAARGRRSWLALVPAGLALYMAYLALAGGDALMPVSRAGSLGPALRGALRGRLGRPRGGLRGRAPAALRPERITSTSRRAGGSPTVAPGTT